MIGSNERIIKIINIILDHDSKITSESLAVELGVSSRTIRNDIKEISEIVSGFGAQLISVVGTGYVIEFDKESEYEFVKFLKSDQKTCKNPGSGIIPTDSVERRHYIVSKLVFNAVSCTKEYIDPYDLADDLFVSYSTLKKDIKLINKELENHGLKILVNQKNGVNVIGSEDNIRYYLADFIFFSKHRDTLNSQNFYEELFGRQEIQDISERLYRILNDNGFTLTDVAFDNIVIHILIVIKRNPLSESLHPFSDKLLNEVDGTKEFEMACQIVDEFLGVNSKNRNAECLNVAQHLLSNHRYSENQNINIEIMDLIDIILTRINKATAIDLFGNKQLIDGLAIHISVAVNRIRYNMTIRNEFIDKIKSSFPFAFEIAVIAAREISEHFDIVVEENEIGLLAIHFGAALESMGLNAKNRYQKVLVVCGFGVATSLLIKETLISNFRDIISEPKTISMRELTKVMIDEYDIILTTVPITDYESDKIIDIPMVLDNKAIWRLNNIINKDEYKIDYSILLKENLYFDKVKINDKDKILNFMTDKMIELNYIFEEDKDSVFTREEMATTEIGNLVALPHVLSSNETIPCVGVAVLEKPILWKEEKVQVVLLLNIPKSVIGVWERLFKTVYTYLINNNGINRLINGISFKEFIRELEREDSKR